MSRWIRFLIAILVGISLGLVYGWWINPTEYVATSPESLKFDYKTDYVLMVAEAYKGEGNTLLAERRLGLLGNTPPLQMVYQAIVDAQKIGYQESDVQLMQTLMSALQTGAIIQGTQPP